MKLKKFLALFLCFAMVFSTMGLPVFADDTNPGEPFGDGSAACAVSLLSEEETLFWSDLADTDWYVEGGTEFTISTAKELAGLAMLVDGYKANDDEETSVSFEDVTITLANDIDLSDAIFNPIGSYRFDKIFKGTFDGAGNSIINMSQNTWALDNGYYYTDCGLGLFGAVENATIKNLTIDGANISGESALCGTVASVASDSIFENITVLNSNVADYQYYAGGIVGWASGNTQYIGCLVDETTTVGAQWGDFDCSVGGVIGGSSSSANILMQDCEINCRIDAYSDVTSSYQWYAYRRAGMLVGNSNITTNLEGSTYAVPDNFVIENCKIKIGDWGNYTYCEFAGTNWPWVRCQEGISNSAYSNPRYGHPTDAEGNEVTDDNHVHNDGEGHQIIIGFSQLFGGGQGVYGATKEVLEKIGGYDSVTESLEIIDLAKEARSCVELFKAVENEELISLNDAEENSVELVSVGLFESLQDAINAMGTDAGEYTIVIKKNITEDVSITQNDGQKVTIKGGTNDVTLNGSITIDGTSIGENDMDDDSLTITGINFVTDTADHTFISGVITNHYPHNVLISDCTFTGTGNNDTVAVRLKSSYDCAIKDCVGTGLHSMLQNTSGHRLTVEDIEINNSKSGISLGTVQGATLKNINITATGDYGYGIRMDGSEYVGDVSIENATINATAPIILRKADKITSSYDIELKGTNNLATPDNSDYTVIVVATDYDEENTVLAASEDKKIFVTIEDESLSIDNVFGAKYPPAVVEDANGNKTTYASLAEAVAEATANDSIVIYDKIEDLATLVNSGTTFKNITVKLGRDFDLNNEEWTPIGTNTNRFLGTFDGDNHTVSNLKIDTPSTSYVGFFGFTSEGEVKNLTINNASVKGRLGVGAFAGSPYTSKMTNLKLTGDVAIEGMSYVGGMLGRNLYANATDLTVDVNDGSYVKATSAENGTRYRTYLGGVIGFMGEGNITVKNVTSNIDVIGDVMDIGGIVGIIHYGNSFINIASSGNVTATSAEAALEIGGIAGTVMNSEQPVTIDKLEYTGNLSVTLEDGTVITEEELSSHKLYGNVYYPDKPTTGMINVAKINDTYYLSLQDAINSAQESDTIEIIGNVNENVTIRKSITIDGADNNYNGTITVSGDVDVTIQNVKFAKGSIEHTGTPNGSLFVKGCSFEYGTTYAVTTASINKVTIEDCTAIGQSLLNAKKSTPNIIIKKVNVSGANYVARICYGSVAYFEEVIAEDMTGYGIQTQNHGAKTITLKNCSFDTPSYSAIAISEKGTASDTFIFEGENSMTSLSDSEYAKYILDDITAILTAPEGHTVKSHNEKHSVVYENGAYSIQKAAKINDVYYATLQEAVDAANAGDTIVVASDVELSETVVVASDDEIILDLNGCTVSMNYTEKATKNHQMILNNGKFTVTDSAKGGKLSYIYTGEDLGVTYAVSTISNAPGSVLTVNAGAIENNTFEQSVIAYAIDALTNGGAGDVTVNINGGTISAKRQAVRVFANSTTKTGTLNITNGDITGRVIMQNPNDKENKAVLNISGGTFNVNEYKTDVLSLGGSLGANMDIDVSITGGTFNGEITSTLSEDKAKCISGGLFATDVSEYTEEGLKAALNYDGTYSIVADRTINVSADKTEVTAGEEVVISVSVDGEKLANAKWKLKYDSSKFELVTTGLNVENDVITDHLYLDDDTVFTSGEVIKSYTFKAIAQTDDTQADFEISDTFAYTYFESLDGTDIEALNNEKATVNIKLKDYNVVVKVDDNEIAAGETTREFAYDDNEHTFKVDTIPTATVEYKVNGRTVNNVVIKAEGEYVIEYTVVADTGYAGVTGTYTITVGAPEYVIEIGATEYVAGKKIVLVYTNTDNSFFKYDGNLMIDVTSSGYKYNDGTTETQYAHVFAFVTDVVTGASDDDYKANVSHLYSSSGLYTIAQYDNDINFDTDLDIRDITSEYAVYNVNADVFRYIRYQKNILKADTDGSKSVTLDDTANVVNGIVNP